MSFGWIHRSFIASGKTGTPFDNYGGEDRFWLGPEGGQYGLYFAPGEPFTFDAWQTPHALQEGAWPIAERAADHVVFEKSLSLKNWSGASFSLEVERTVRVLLPSDVKRILGHDYEAARYTDHVAFVGFETKNRIVNTGTTPWRKDMGLLSIWILSMFTPSEGTKVIVPYETKVPAGTPLVNDRYFGKVPPERLRADGTRGFLSFTADGRERGKIGLTPERAKDRLGSISNDKLLTVVQYDTRKIGAPYVNSMWEKQAAPYAGDAVNSYNDGPPAPGKPPLGGFYELETSSPGAELGPGQALVHTQRTFHFDGANGDRTYIEELAGLLLLGDSRALSLGD
jgi:hypothetical protein